MHLHPILIFASAFLLILSLEEAQSCPHRHHRKHHHHHCPCDSSSESRERHHHGHGCPGNHTMPHCPCQCPCAPTTASPPSTPPPPGNSSPPPAPSSPPPPSQCTQCPVDSVTMTPGNTAMGMATPTSRVGPSDLSGCITLNITCNAKGGQVFMQFNTEQGGPLEPIGTVVSASLNCNSEKQWVYKGDGSSRVIKEVNCVLT